MPYNGISIAVNDFLNSIKKDIGEKKFGDLMLIDGGATLIFTVDTTGSMRDEIDAARGIASSIITMPRKFPVDYLLSPFNDPGKIRIVSFLFDMIFAFFVPCHFDRHCIWKSYLSFGSNV